MTNNLTYTRCGDYYIPSIKLSYTEPIEWNCFSRMARTCLKEYRPIKEYSVPVQAIARPREEGDYEIIAGHR